MDRFGELRSVLQLPPSRGVWRRICTLSERWPDAQAFAETVAPYINAHLESWPSDLRVAPATWLARLLQGEEEPALALSRCVRVDIDPMEPEASTSPLELAPLMQEFWALLDAVSLEHIEVLDLRGCALAPSALEQMCAHSGWRGLQHVHIHGARWPAEAMGAWFAWLAERPVSSLALNDAIEGDFDPTLLARSPLAPKLGALGLGAVSCEIDVLGALLRAEVCPELRRVDLINLEALVFSTSEAPFLTLAERIDLPRLERLGLSSLSVGNEELVQLASVPWFSRLRTLDVSWNELDGEGLMALPADSALRHLYAHNNYVMLEELPEVAHHPGLGRLETLGVGVVAGSDPDAAWAQVGAGLPSLRALSVSANSELAEREVGAAFLSSPVAARLERFELHQTTYLPPGLPAWSKWLAGAMPRLSHLELTGCGMSGQDVQALLSPGLGRVRELGLWRNDLRDDDTDWMCEHEALEALDVLDVRANLLTARGFETLCSCDALERCELSWVNIHTPLERWRDE